MDIATLALAIIVVFMACTFKGGSRGAKAQTWVKKKLRSVGLWILKGPRSLSERIFSKVPNKTVAGICTWTCTVLLYIAVILIIQSLWTYMANGVIALLS